MHYANLLLAERNQWALDQAEVGALVGVSADTIGNYELAKRAPLSLATALGLELVYGKPIASLFPDTVRSVAALMVQSAQDLSIKIEERTDEASFRKREFLKDLGDRLRSYTI